MAKLFHCTSDDNSGNDNSGNNCDPNDPTCQLQDRIGQTQRFLQNLDLPSKFCRHFTPAAGIVCYAGN